MIDFAAGFYPVKRVDGLESVQCDELLRIRPNPRLYTCLDLFFCVAILTVAIR